MLEILLLQIALNLVSLLEWILVYACPKLQALKCPDSSSVTQKFYNLNKVTLNFLEFPKEYISI